MSAALAEAASGKRPSQAGAVIVDADWQKLQEYLSSYDAKREDVIKQCRGAKGCRAATRCRSSELATRHHEGSAVGQFVVLFRTHAALKLSMPQTSRRTRSRPYTRCTGATGRARSSSWQRVAALPRRCCQPSRSTRRSGTGSDVWRRSWWWGGVGCGLARATRASHPAGPRR